MFDYSQRPSNQYMDKFDDIEWNSKKESGDAATNAGGEQESIYNKVCFDKEGREAQREDG